jgi:hypothetical protein
MSSVAKTLRSEGHAEGGAFRSVERAIVARCRIDGSGLRRFLTSPDTLGSPGADCAASPGET